MSLSIQETVEMVLEFLEVAIHCILFVREVYPIEIFERRRKYNVPVAMSRSQSLNQYIGQALNSLRDWMLKGIVEVIAVLIIEEEIDKVEIVVERFNFEISFPYTHGGSTGLNPYCFRKLSTNSTTLKASSITNDSRYNMNNSNVTSLPSTGSGLTITEMEYALRAFLLKINTCDALLGSNRKERTFKLIVYSREDDLVKRSLSWIPITSSEVGIGHQFTSSDLESSGNDKLSGICSRLKTNGSDSDHMKMRAAMHDYDKSLPRVIPLKSFVNDQLKLQLYIEKLPRN